MAGQADRLGRRDVTGHVVHEQRILGPYTQAPDREQEDTRVWFGATYFAGQDYLVHGIFQTCLP